MAPSIQQLAPLTAEGLGPGAPNSPLRPQHVFWRVSAAWGGAEQLQWVQMFLREDKSSSGSFHSPGAPGVPWHHRVSRDSGGTEGGHPLGRGWARVAFPPTDMLGGTAASALAVHSKPERCQGPSYHLINPPFTTEDTQGYPAGRWPNHS